MKLGPLAWTALQRGAHPKTPGQHRLQIGAGARRRIDDSQAATVLKPIRETLPAAIFNGSSPTSRHAPPLVSGLC